MEYKTDFLILSILSQNIKPTQGDIAFLSNGFDDNYWKADVKKMIAEMIFNYN